MLIYEDVANKLGQHVIKNRWFANHNIEVRRVPLPVGDYILDSEKVQDVISRKTKRGVELKKMDFMGSYNVTVDSKNGIEEIISNVCGKSHARFRDECILSQNNGIKLYILVENKGGLIPGTKGIYNDTVRSIDDLFHWKNPRLFLMKNSNEVIGRWKNGAPRYKRVQKFPSATKGSTLAKACLTLQERYGCEFVFCEPEESGAKIIELLMEKEG